MRNTNLPEAFYPVQFSPDLPTGTGMLFKISVINNGHKINNENQAYSTLLKAWDKEVMSWVKEYRTLVLDASDRPKLLITFPVLGESADQLNISRLFDLIKKYEPEAKKVIIAQNSPEKTVLPDDDEEKMAMEFVLKGNKTNITVFRHLIMSPNSMFAFDHPKGKRQIASQQMTRS